MTKLWICGDSVLRGVVWSPEGKRYIQTDWLGYGDMEAHFGITIDNRSRFGATIEKGREHIEAKMARGETCDVALLEYGGNDSDFNWAEVSLDPYGEHISKTPIDRFEALYRDTVRMLRSKGIMPVLCTLVPVCATRYLDWVSRNGLSKDNILAWLGDENAIYRYQERYARVVEKIAAEEGCGTVDLRGAFLSVRQMEPLFCEDGIHPSQAGQRLIHDTLLSLPSTLLTVPQKAHIA